MRVFSLILITLGLILPALSNSKELVIDSLAVQSLVQFTLYLELCDNIPLAHDILPDILRDAALNTGYTEQEMQHIVATAVALTIKEYQTFGVVGTYCAETKKLFNQLGLTN